MTLPKCALWRSSLAQAPSDLNRDNRSFRSTDGTTPGAHCYRPNVSPYHGKTPAGWVSCYNGGIPSRPAKRRPQSVAARAVEPIRTNRARLAHGERQPPPWDRFRYQPRPNMTRVSTRNGQLSTRNAGARASPEDAPPIRPSRPGTTHHHGSGSSPLNKATKGFSTCKNFSMGHHSLSRVGSSFKPLMTV